MIVSPAGAAPKAGSAPDDRPGARRAWLLLGAAIVVVRAVLSLATRQAGYLEYNADGYARIVHAAAWARAPHLEVGVWLPLQFWLTGAALWLWPDLTVTPVALNFAASVGSALLLAAIGFRLGGAAAGWLTGLLAAAFPWSIWFGLSGLADALFAAAVAAAGLGLARWLTLPRSPAALWLAGGALLVSTMLRYEGWFYSLALVLVVTPGLTAAEWRRPRIVAALALPFLFPLVWVSASAALNGDPFAFAFATSDITAAEGTHLTLTPLERLIYYPSFLVTLAWPVVGVALAGAIGYWRRPGIAGYLLWVLGELAILSLVTSRFAGIGAGRDRYIMSNIVLLLPLAAVLLGRWGARVGSQGGAGALAAATQRAHHWLLPAAGRLLLILLLLWFALSTLLGRQHRYPAPDTVALATRLRTAWETGQALGDQPIPVEVAVPGQDDAFNESYALQVLTNRPAALQFFWDLDLFNQVVADQAPTAWITDARLTNPNRPRDATREEIGVYTIHHRPPPPQVALAGPARPGATLQLTASGLPPGETAGLWLTASDGRTIDLGQARADASGVIRHAVTLPSRLPPGAYTLSLRAAGTGATGHASLSVGES